VSRGAVDRGVRATAARRFPDSDLELCALSQLGGALVLMGKLDEGSALLDEAMAGALGGEGDPETVVHASCVNIICSSRASDIKRAMQPRRFLDPALLEAIEDPSASHAASWSWRRRFCVAGCARSANHDCTLPHCWSC
jgi:hypothetical protein